MQININFLQVGIIIFDGSGQTCPQYPKQEVGDVCETYEEESVATVFVFYSDAKHSDATIMGIQSYSLLLVI